ncbi:MBL fold metallo-hydrolase [Pseudomonas sp. CCM 7891]|uniref:MBL fold metallo-hydrolase n=1 Tax=Pseudomonas karstica TaxID=1055468 RepID=A0A7X2V011_9PSED|nr:MBL fold metallo-hydrolase [Pseudomonas karstica]MTD20772.1 MBL fold metallo-hydrolase [Pseudomonas karstica]
MVSLYDRLSYFAGVLLMAVLCVCLETCPARAAQAPVAPLELLVLGSGGPGAGGRAGAGYVLLLDGTPRILLDAGPGTFVRLGEARLDVRNLNIVLLTHLHADHVGELPGFVKARAVAARSDINFDVFGPGTAPSFPSTRQFIDLMFGQHGAFGYLQDFAGTVTFSTTDLDNISSVKTLYSQDGLEIHAIAGHHRDAPAVIYRVDYKGKNITFSGDIDEHGHAALRQIAKGSNLLVFNAPILDPPNSPAALYALHTAPVDIGRISATAAVSSLLLSHLSRDIDESRDAVTRSIGRSYQGPVQFAKDGLRIRL